MRVRTTRDLAAAARQRRKQRGWSQAHLAEETGVGRDWVIQFEKGKSSVELELVLKLLAALELPLNVEAEPGNSGGEPTPSEEAVRVHEEPTYQLPTNLL